MVSELLPLNCCCRSVMSKFDTEIVLNMHSVFLCAVKDFFQCSKLMFLEITCLRKEASCLVVDYLD